LSLAGTCLFLNDQALIASVSLVRLIHNKVVRQKYLNLIAFCVLAEQSAEYSELFRDEKDKVFCTFTYMTSIKFSVASWYFTNRSLNEMTTH